MAGQKRWALATLLLLLTGAVTVAQPADEEGLPAGPPPASAAEPIENPDELLELWQIRTDLRAEDRPWHVVRAAEAFAERNGIAAPSWLWQTAQTRIEELSREHVAATRQAYEAELVALLKRIDEYLLIALPPVAALDVPNDKGTAIVVLWRPIPGAEKVEIARRDVTRDKPFSVIKDDAAAAASEWKNESLVHAGHQYQYRLTAIGADGSRRPIGESNIVQARGEWFHTKRWNLLAVVLILSGTVFLFIQLAKRGFDLKIRKIAGLEAVDEAVGRATEMGRPIMFIPGIQDMNDIQTVAGLIILGRVARTAAEHDAQIEVPTARSLVMTAARETVSASYLDVGRPDGYDEKKIYYTTDEQFGYVAAVTGAMVREKPATCFYMGAFFAESLILAETANATGSIQIAGTAMPAQLPFFVAACDYTLIGEEFFAASAYLSGEPQQLGSLKGQDVGKMIALVLIALGGVAMTAIKITEQQFGSVGQALDMLQKHLLNTAG